jgi:hypothetical protein
MPGKTAGESTGGIIKFLFILINITVLATEFVKSLVVIRQQIISNSNLLTIYNEHYT